MKVFLLILALIIISFTPLDAQEISGNFQQGSIRIGPDTTPCDGTRDGAIRYDSTSKIYEFCYATDWRKIVTETGTGAPPIPPAGNGHFVITSGQWDGNLGGMAGANAKCLADLTANDWLGKATSTVDATHVFAFICPNITCNNPLPNTTYNFAVSGDVTKGGASFTVDASQRGPGNNIAWTGTNYFDGIKEYFTGRSWSGTTSWWHLPSSDNNNNCNSWTSNSAIVTGRYGNSNNTDHVRWGQWGPTCDIPKHLLCFVHP